MSFQRLSPRANMVMNKRDDKDTQRQHVFETMAKLYGWDGFIEIGVRKGNTGLHLLRTCPNLGWIGVDPYAVPTGNVSESGFYDHTNENREAHYRLVSTAIKPYGDRATLIRDYSAGAHDLVDDHVADCVFIDGDHRCEFVKQDIELWLPKLKPGGWLTGHDIDWDSVKQAVTELFPSYIELPDAIWAVKLDGPRV